VITNQPASQIVAFGADATFTAGVSGTAPFSYQWRFQGAALSGATNASLTITNVQAASLGGYQLVVANLAGSATSALATLTVEGQPVLVNVQRLGDGTVRMGITGSPNRTYAIEAGTDLQNWSLVGSVAYTNGIMPFTDSTAPGTTNRFYRARWVP
jgi:hypothetical protein